MKIYKSNKTVLSLRNNAVAFLNGLTSNAMDKPWNAFVDIHGMIISVFDQLVFKKISVKPLKSYFPVAHKVKHLFSIRTRFIKL